MRSVTGPAIAQFMYLGAKHMVTGYDHVLFLVGVIFFLYRARDVVAYVSLFTIGHSVTLLVGVLGKLSARIRTLLRRGQGSEVRFLQVGNLTFDPITRVVKRGERRLDLSQKEAALLEYLMRHAGQPLTRAMISEHVWNSGWHGLTNVIDVYISHLRKKVDADAEPPLIHAVRGTGYVIRDPAPHA